MRVAAFGAVLLLTIPPVGAQNLLPDPSFASGVGAWTAVGASSASVQWIDFPGSDGVAGFARLQGLGPGFLFAQTCVPIVGGRTYSWGATLRPGSATSGLVVLELYPNPSCQGFALVGQVAGPAASGTGAWQFEPAPDVIAPASAGSVMFRATLVVPGNGVGLIDFDNVYFGPQGTLPPGVKDVPALSWPAVCVFAALLATMGLRLLRHA